MSASNPSPKSGAVVSAQNFKFDVVIVGAGPAGLAAACAAAESNSRVAVIDETPWLGGQIWRGSAEIVQSPKSKVQSPKTPGRHYALPASASLWINRFHQSGATLLDRTTVIASPRPGLLLCEHNNAPPKSVRNTSSWPPALAKRSLPFPGWTLPGIMGPGGLQAMVKQGGPLEGKRVVIAGSGPLLLAVADGLRKHGAKVVCICEQAPFSRVSRFVFSLLPRIGKAWQAARLRFAMLGHSLPLRSVAGQRRGRFLRPARKAYEWPHDLDRRM